MNPRYGLIVIAVVLALAGATPAARQQREAPADRAALDLLARTSRDAQQFDRIFDQALGRNPNQPINPSPMENEVDQLVSELMDTTVHLRDHYQRSEVIAADVDDVLNRGARIDKYMRRTSFPAEIDRSWHVVRQDLDDLARQFNVAWNWDSPPPRAPRPEYYDRLSGTYALDRTRSDDARRAAVEAARDMPPGQRQRVEQDLIDRLDPPEVIALDRNGSTVSLASSKAPRATFDIDGRPRTEPNGYGGVSIVRASLYGDELMVRTTGNRGRDFTVTFEPLNAGGMLQVTRNVDAEGLSAPVQTRSVYRRTSDQADWNLYAPPPPPSAGDALVPSGTVLVGQLSVPLGSRTSRQGDRFSLTVTGPRQFKGAVIDGIVTRVNASGRSGRNELFFDFNRIRLRDGRTSEFAGVLNQVRTPDGRIVMVDTEGVVEAGESRSTQAVQGGAVGAAVGAIIGAIAGGGKGAAIGAAVGAGAGAGTVYVASGDLDLPRGTEVHIIAQPVWERR